VSADEKATPADEPTAEESSEAVEITEPGDVAEDFSDEIVEDSGEKNTEVAGRTGARGKRGAILGVVLVAAALVVSAGVAGWLYFYQYRLDQQTNAAAANVALEAAKSGTVALLSYSPDTLENDFTAAKSNLTGDFLSYYTQFTEQIVTPAAKEKKVKTVAAVIRAAVSEIRPDSATVLLFINQTTTSKENPDGAFAASSVKVGLKKIDDRWMINTFDPV
jgi:Mce-associated membrane protein